MVRFLSVDWFDRLREHAGPLTAPDGSVADGKTSPLVLRHLIRSQEAIDDDPGRDYDVVIGDGRAEIRHPATGRADLTFTTDYPTAAAIAAGRLSTHAALAEGRLRVAGDVGILARRAADVAGLDPVPADLRAETRY